MKSRASRRTASRKSPRHELSLLDEVLARSRLSRWTIWRIEKAGRFPKSMQIGFKRIAWRTDEIDAWIAGRWVPRPAEQSVAA